MKIQDIQGMWLRLKGRVKEELGDLSDNEVMEINGKFENLVGKLQQRLDISEEAAWELVSGLRDVDGEMQAVSVIPDDGR